MRATGFSNRGVMERKRQPEIESEKARAASNCAIQATVKNFNLRFETFFADVAFGRRTRCLLPGQQHSPVKTAAGLPNVLLRTGKGGGTQ